MAYEEDSPPMAPPAPRGILSSSTTTPTMGLSPMGENMAPDSETTDEESVHAQTIMEAIKSGDSEVLRDTLKAFVKACVRDYNKSPAKPE